MAVQISVQASQTALAQSIAQGVAAFNARYASQNQLNLQINAGSFTQPLGRITGNLKEFESALAASNARVLAFGASTAVIGGVGKAFREIADVTIEVEKNLTDINRVLGLSTDRLQKFSSDLFGVAKQTASSFQDAAKASLEFSRQGLNAEDTLKKTADALTLVRLTGVSAAQAVEDLTAATNAFKETGLTTNDILNKIVAVEQQFAVSADDLTSAVSRTGQAAKEAGVNFDQLNALVASAQEKTARGGAVIGNALKTIFTRLQRTETLDQLENFNIAVRDIEGNVLPAIQILQNFAGAYKDLSTAQKASLSEQVAGVYQVNILKSIITDLNDKQGVYNKALDYGTQATNEAEQANAKLNLTLAALISQTGTNLQQLSNNIGKVTFEPVFKSLVSPFNDAVTYINDLLEGEGIGSQFANGLLLGIKNILSGPGLVGAVAVIGKVITNTFSYASSALPALFGITTETQKRKNIEEAVLKIIQSQSQVSLALRGQQGNLVAQSQTLFNLAQAQTAEYQQQLATAKQLAAALTPRNITVGQAGLQVGKIKAGGYIPRDVQNAEVMGAAIGGYKAGKVINAPVGGVMNSAEKVKYIPGFAQPFINPPAGSKAGRMHRIKSINQTGVDPYMNSGFIPNFASAQYFNKNKQNDVLTLNGTEKKPFIIPDNQELATVSDPKKDSVYGLKYKIQLAGSYSRFSKAFDNKMLSPQQANKFLLFSSLEKDQRDVFINNYKKYKSSGQDFAVKPFTANKKETILFSKQLQGVKSDTLGQLYELYLQKKFGLEINPNQTSVSDLDFIDAEAKIGDFSSANLLSKAIRDSAKKSGIDKPYYRNNTKDKIDLNDKVLTLYTTNASQGFIPNFATGLSPKVTRLPWLKSFANKEWFNRFPWFNDIDLKNTSQNMDYNPYTGERKLVAGSEMFRELNFLTHGNNKNITTGNSPLFSYLYEEYVRDILNEVTKNKSIKDAEEAGFPMRDKYGNPTKFDPFKAANTAPMDALIRNRAGRIGGIEIKGGTEENWKTKDILKKEQDFETQNPGSTLGRRTRVYSNMYKGTDFLTKGLLKRLGVDKAKTITNKLISFYADKIAGHESEIENNWRTNKGLSNGFIPNFVKKAQSIPPRSKSTEPYRRGTNWWWETKKGYISAIQKAKNTYEIEGIEVYDKYKGQGESTKFYKGIAEKIGPGNNITGVLLPQEQALADYASGKPVPAKAIFPQLAWAKTAKSSKLLVNGKEMAISDFEKGIANHKYNASKLEMALIELINSHASGFIPNFAYQQAVMSLEESMSGNKAILDTTTGPFPFVRNSSQPNFASAVADHGGVQNALKDSMAGQKAAGLIANGNIPNFAAPNPITLTGKGYAGNAKVEQTINNYLKSIDILTTSNSNIKKALDNLYKTLGLTGQEFDKLKTEVIAHANAERKAAQAFIGPMPQQNTPVNQGGNAPLLPGRGTFGRNLQAGTLRAARGSSRFFGGLGSNLAFTLGAPLIAGQLESAITQGRDRSQLSESQRFLGSAASSVLTNVSTGAALGTALAPILGPLAPFGPLIGVAGGALTGLASAAMGASDNLEDLQKKSETYRNETQSAIESGKGIIDTIKALGNLDPNSLEAFDANQKLEEYFTKISETGLDEKFKEAGNDIEKMTQAIKDYEMERVAGAKRATEAVNRKAKTDLSIEELGKKNILRTEKAAVTKYSQNQGLGGATSSYVVMEDVIASSGAAGEANFEKLASQNSQLFEDLSKIQKGVGEDFTDFVKVVQEEFNSFEFNQDTVKGFLKKYNIEGVDVKEFAATLEAINEENGKYGKTLSTNLFDIFKSIQENRTKTAADKAAKAQEIAQRVEGVRQALFRYSQAIEQAIANTAMQIENYDFEKSFGKLNLEKSSQLINDGLAAISKNIDNAFKNQFDLLVGETANIQQKKMLDFDAANFERGFELQKQSRTLGRSKELVTVLQGALEETAAGNIDQVVEAFQKTGKVDISTISGLKKGEESKRAIQAFNLTTSLEEKAARNKDENARKTFMAEQAYANKSLELKSAVGKLDYDLSERRYKNTLREKELVDSITNQNKQIQIKGQAEIERSRIETESPYFMLGRGEFAISDEKRAREAQNTQKGFELEARQAIADAEIARIQREVFADNTDATLQNTTAIEDLIMAMTQQGNAAFNAQQDVIKNIDSQIEAKQRKLTYDFEPGDTQGSMELQKEINDLKAEKENIIGSKEYVSNKASADLRNRQIEMQVARQELQNRRAKGGSFGSMDLSSIKDPVNYLKERASEERKVLQTLEDQKESLIIQSEEGNLTLEQSQKLKTLDEQIAKQRSVVNDVDNANLSIQEKITTEKTRQNQLDKDREKRGKFGTGVSKALGDIRTEIDTFEERLGGTTVTAFRDGLVGAMDAAINKTDDLGSALLEVAGGFLKSIQNAMFQQIANQIVSGAGFAIGKQKGGVIHAQAGMYISDGGRTGDVNPAMLEDGEYVLNRKTVKALGGPKEIDKLNFGMFPRFGGPTRRFADGGNTGSMQAAASMNEPFAQLSEFGKENNPEYQKYLERIREEQAKKDAKKAQKDALVRSLIGTALTTGIMMGVGSLAKGMTGPKVGGAKPSSTQLSQLKKAGVTINESGLPNMQKGGVLHFANGGYLPYGNRLNDSIPALLSGGEYIVNSKAVRKYGVGGLNRINSGVARFQDGGLVGDVAKTNANTESSTSNNVSVNITVNATDGKAQNEQSSADGGDDKNRALGNKIKEVVLQVITNEQRTGGLLDSTKKK
jgi:TP901 family phage tail tape measure protein